MCRRPATWRCWPRALITEFPEYRDYFKIPAIKFGDKTLKNYNALVERYPGTTGMKTGFICASGFNLVASARRGGREVIAVVFGAYGGKDRAERAAALLDEGFDSGGLFGRSGKTLDTISSGSRYTTPPDMRPFICSGNRAAMLSEADESAGKDAPERTSLGPPIYMGPPVRVSILRAAPQDAGTAVAATDMPRLPRPRPGGVANAFAPDIPAPDDPLRAVIDQSKDPGAPGLMNGLN